MPASATNGSINIFWSLIQARVVIADWKHEYNHHRRHSALAYLPPAHYSAVVPFAAIPCLHAKS